MSEHVSIFAYGTLQVPSVMQAVTGGHYDFAPAILSGYQRFKIRNQSFPGIIRQADASVDGVIYRHIDQQALHLLDQFEDVCYQREWVDVDVQGNIEQAFVYVVTDDYRKYLTDQAWSLEEFKRKYLKGYLSRI